MSIRLEAIKKRKISSEALERFDIYGLRESECCHQQEAIKIFFLIVKEQFGWSYYKGAKYTDLNEIMEL